MNVTKTVNLTRFQAGPEDKTKLKTTQQPTRVGQSTEEGVIDKSSVFYWLQRSFLSPRVREINTDNGDTEINRGVDEKVKPF